MRGLVLLLGLLLLAPTAAAHHPGSNKGLQGLLPAVTDSLTPLDPILVHRLPNVDRTFAEWEAAYPELVERSTIGETSSGQPLYNLRVTDESVPFDAPWHSSDQKLRIYLDGGHHGNEFLGVELVMYYLAAVIDRASSGDVDTLAFLSKVEIYATPIINVDGNLLDTRKNSNLVDPNRNYDFMWGGDDGSSGSFTDFTYRGPSAFSEGETRSNAEFQTQIRPDVVITMHTGIAEFYWPWGWSHDPAPDDAMFTSLEQPFENATNGRVDAMQGAELYIVNGASDDWAYAVLGAPGFTFEVHEDQFIPVYGEEIPTIIEEQLAGLEWVIDNVRHLGAWVELVDTGAGWVARNEGWGVATNVTLTAGGRTIDLPDIARDSSVAIDAPVDGATTWSYNVLLINSTKVRTHTLDVASTASVDGAANVPAPGVGLALGALVVAVLALRRRGA